jgi:transcriptional regulator with XRE-family HTH domain
MINSAQIRAARGLLKWTQAALAAKAGVSIVTMNMIEAETVRPRKTTLEAIQRVLESGGVEFIGDENAGLGVKFRPPSPAGCIF